MALRRTVGMAAAVGMIGGTLFGSGENALLLALGGFGEGIFPRGSVLQDLVWNLYWAAAFASFVAALAGVGLWAGARVRHRPLADATVIGVSAAALTLPLVCAELWALFALASRNRPLGSPERAQALGVFAASIGAVVAAVAVGYNVHDLARRVRRPRTLLAGAVAFACALLALSTGLVLSHGSGAPTLAPRPSRAPNILWIVMDSARADALSCYGNPRSTTPNLDQLAWEGILYKAAFTVAPWTLPSHASMFTGKLPSRHGATAERPYLEPEHTTIAELLAAHGYRTYCGTANPYLARHPSLLRGFQAFDVRGDAQAMRRSAIRNLLEPLVSVRDDGACGLNRLARRWVAQAFREKRPFFIFLNYMELHPPYGSSPYRNRWLSDHASQRRAAQVSQDYAAYTAGELKGSPDDFALLRALYDGDASYLDERIGELLDFLRETQTLDNTIVIITSDHGESLGEQGLINHAFGLHNSLLRVPLIIRYPGAFGPGWRSDWIVQTIDLSPTLLGLVPIGWEERRELQGRGLLERKQDEPAYAIAERELPLAWVNETIKRFPRWQGPPLWRRLKCIQDSRFKCLWASDGTVRLHDLRADPAEANDLSAAMPDKVRQLIGILAARTGGKLAQ